MDEEKITALLKALGISDEGGTSALLPALKVTHSDDHSTKAFAASLGIKPESLNSHLSRFGSYYGVRPKKLPNGRSRWPSNGKDLIKRQGKGR